MGCSISTREPAEATLRRHHATDEPACLVMLDIDHFKQINDQHGHTVGDEVLRALARIVLSNVRATDCAGRYGGDEFAIVLRGMHLYGATADVERAVCMDARDAGFGGRERACARDGARDGAEGEEARHE